MVEGWRVLLLRPIVAVAMVLPSLLLLPPLLLLLLLLAAGGAACGVRAAAWVRGVRGVHGVCDGWCSYCDSRSCCGAAGVG